MGEKRINYGGNDSDCLIANRIITNPDFWEMYKCVHQSLFSSPQPEHKAIHTTVGETIHSFLM